ncbi:MAG: polysaccharide deacetylase family protein, partial [Thermodesulfobacteriota bacterium]|nr:polysaccharide deacetylase family protein [Thermodesulfobacteriota bacterium]
MALPALIAGLGLSARFTWWRPNLAGVPVLMYHYLTDDVAGTSLKKLRVSPSAFARQVDYLAGRGYQSMGLWDYFEHAAAGRVLPELPVIITFDDGGRDCLLRARDVLSRRGFTATVFPVAEYVGKTNIWDRPKGEPEIELLNGDE